MEVAKDIVFPSRVLKRQLENAQHRLKEMEEELETIKNKEQQERKRRKKARVGVALLRVNTSLPYILSTAIT